MQGKWHQHLQVRNCCLSTCEVFAHPQRCLCQLRHILFCTTDSPEGSRPSCLATSLSATGRGPRAGNHPTPLSPTSSACPPLIRAALQEPHRPAAPRAAKPRSGSAWSHGAPPAASPAQAQGAVRALQHNHPAQSFFPFYLHHPCLCGKGNQ